MYDKLLSRNKARKRGSIEYRKSWITTIELNLDCIHRLEITTVSISSQQKKSTSLSINTVSRKRKKQTFVLILHRNCSTFWKATMQSSNAEYPSMFGILGKADIAVVCANAFSHYSS